MSQPEPQVTPPKDNQQVEEQPESPHIPPPMMVPIMPTDNGNSVNQTLEAPNPPSFNPSTDITASPTIVDS